jgi:hypothetical protein
MAWSSLWWSAQVGDCLRPHRLWLWVVLGLIPYRSTKSHSSKLLVKLRSLILCRFLRCPYVGLGSLLAREPPSEPAFVTRTSLLASKWTSGEELCGNCLFGVHLEFILLLIDHLLPRRYNPFYLSCVTFLFILCLEAMCFACVAL